MSTTANPIDLFRYWKGLPWQDEAIIYWWEQTPQAVKEKITAIYRRGPTDPLYPLSVIGWERTSADFKQKLGQIAHRLDIHPVWLAAVISFETGGTFSPSIRNMAGSGATGLIQFMPSTARGLGTTTDQLAAMDAVTQLDWVERYFQPYKGRMKTLHDTYMAVLWPAAVGRGPDFVLFQSPTVAYRQNAGLDWDKDGRITAVEASRKVAERVFRLN